MDSISINTSYEKSHVLLTGATGFVGKVLLSMMLDRFPEIGRIYILVRPKRPQSALQRFEVQLAYSHAFKPLHEAFQGELSEYVSQRVEVLEGDVTKPNLGLDDDTAARVQQNLDLVINCAGLVDFNPDPRTGVATNVDGTLNVLEFVRQSDRAKLLHVSTCYVAGNRSGIVPEEIRANYRPDGAEFDAEQEYKTIFELIQQTIEEQDGEKATKLLQSKVMKRMAENGTDISDYNVFNHMLQRQKRRELKKALTNMASDRAGELGWPNTYTYTKSLAESLLVSRAGDVEFTVVRPSIVESAIEFPLPGWNEGFNTCGPLVYVLSTWFRHLRCDPNNALDIIPVDTLCHGMLISGAALLKGTHKSCYQLASSAKNPISLERCVELVSLGHRQHLRKHGKKPVDRFIRSRFDSVTVEGDHLHSISNLRVLAESLGKLIDNVPDGLPGGLKKRAEKAQKTAKMATRQLKFLDKIFETFKPFVEDNKPIFIADNIDEHMVEEDSFPVETENLCWRTYWLKVHQPGLRRWCFPVLKGKSAEIYRPKFPVKLFTPETPKLPTPAERREAKVL